MRKSKNFRRVVFVIVIIFINILFYRYISIGKKKINNINHDGDEIEIHMIDVGQAESILIIQGENTILIDTGEMSCGKVIVDYLSKVGIDKIDYLILTHFHKDHIGGAHKIISSLEIEKIICMDSKYFSSLQEWFWYIDMSISKKVNELMYGKKIQLETPYDENGNLRKFLLGNSEITFLSQEIDTEIVNNKSIVTKLLFGNFSALFMADAEVEIEENLIEDKANMEVKLLKVGHHGSNTSSTSKFLELTNPEIALISCGEDNDYLHPHNSVLSRLKGVKIYRTDINGSIIVKSDGNNIFINTEK